MFRPKRSLFLARKDQYQRQLSIKKTASRRARNTVLFRATFFSTDRVVGTHINLIEFDPVSTSKCWDDPRSLFGYLYNSPTTPKPTKKRHFKGAQNTSVPTHQLPTAPRFLVESTRSTPNVAFFQLQHTGYLLESFLATSNVSSTFSCFLLLWSLFSLTRFLYLLALLLLLDRPLQPLRRLRYDNINNNSNNMAAALHNWARRNRPIFPDRPIRVRPSSPSWTRFRIHKI
jgi:hypothetical protein